MNRSLGRRRLLQALAAISVAALASLTDPPHGLVVSTGIALPAHAQPPVEPQETSERSAGTDGGLLPLETRVARTLEANPGSSRISENVVRFEQGVVAILPRDGGSSISSASDCNHGWLCMWPHADFRGPALGVPSCVFIWLDDWWYNESTGVIKELRNGNLPPPWHFYYERVSSVYNLLPGVEWGRFYSYRNRREYGAKGGAPVDYVGDEWNDSFTWATGCQ